MDEPSWSEIRHFVKFLDLQLNSCENSAFTDPETIKNALAGMKGFVVKFMISMSRVSLNLLCIRMSQEIRRSTIYMRNLIHPDSIYLAHPVIMIHPDSICLAHPVIMVCPDSICLAHPVIMIHLDSICLAHPVIIVHPDSIFCLAHPVIMVHPDMKRKPYLCTNQWWEELRRILHHTRHTYSKLGFFEICSSCFC